MKYFDHIKASSFEEASDLLKASNGKSEAIAGGTDLLGVLKDRILDTYPESVVSIKKIHGADSIEEKDGKICIGSQAKLTTLSEQPLLKEKSPALAEAAHSVASPLIRSLATIGGNLCQDVRCWYYRYPDSIGGAFHCKRKGGETCYAIHGENRYHSVFGGMSCHGSSCSHSCPAGTDIPGYMKQLRAGNWEEAANIIMQYNPFPMLTSRICPHPCQDGCNQCNYGDSVNIHGVERSLADYILKHTDQFYPVPKEETGKKAAVIGAGPGGLAAAYYLRKAGHAVTVFDKMEKAGGVLQYGIPHYRLPKSFVDKTIKAIEDMGTSFRLGVTIGTDITVEEIQKEFDYIYFGTGAWKQPILGLEGEELTQFGLNFLVEVNTFLKKAAVNQVLVCGGGNVAMDVALTAVRLGAEKVQLICLEQENEMPASPEEVARAKEEGVEIHNGWGLSRIVSDNGKVSGLEVKKCVSVYDENHRFAPVYDDSVTEIIASDTIILATGQRVDTSFLGDKLASQIRSDRGLINTDPESFKTSQNGIYAGGDAVTGPNIAIRAIQSGRVAAHNINKEAGIAKPQSSKKTAFRHFDADKIKETCAKPLPELPMGKRSLTAEDTSSYSSRDDAVSEAGRCMNCGCYAVSPSDLAPVLVMLEAEIVTTSRTLSASELFTSSLSVHDVLKEGELIREIRVPTTKGIAHYDKKRVRDAIDFAIISLASCITVENGIIQDARLVLGSAAPVPYRLSTVEAFLSGKTISDDTVKEAAKLAVENACTMDQNEYKLSFIQSILQETLLRAGTEN